MLLVGLMTLACAPAHARPVPPPIQTYCLFGSGLNDGCMQAPLFMPGSAAVFHPTGRQPGDWVNQLAATSTNYVTNGPAWNLAGIDYADGVYTPLSSLLDPATNSMPPGCVYNATGNTSGGGLITCTYPAFTLLSGWNFGPVGGHTCTAVVVLGSGGVGHITDNYFLNDASCSVGTDAVSQLVISAPDHTSSTLVDFNTDR